MFFCKLNRFEVNQNMFYLCYSVVLCINLTMASDVKD